MGPAVRILFIMKRLLAALLSVAACAVVTAQPLHDVQRAFCDGESLMYTVSYRAKMWPNTDMGDVVMAVKQDTIGTVPVLRVDARATVKGIFSWFYRLDDRYYSWLHDEDIYPLCAKAELLEGNYRFSSTFIYDWERDVANNEYRNHRYPEYAHAAVALAGRAMDGVSLFYNLRTHDLSSFSPGEERALALLLTDTVKFIKYKYYGREVKKVKGLGEVNTLKFSCQLVNDDADSFEEGSEFFVWISDDANKIPVFLESPLRVGSVRARLVEYSGLMHPTILNQEE